MWYRFKVYKDNKWMFNGTIYAEDYNSALKQLVSEYGSDYTYNIELIR